MSDEIVLLKLVSTEEVVSKVVSQDDENMTLSKPRVLYPVQQHDGSVSAALIPWLMGAQDPITLTEGDVVLSKSSIIGTVLNVPDPLVKEYTAKTSGIDLS